MVRIIICLLIVLSSHVRGQQGFPQYYRLAALAAQGDSLYAARKFKLAALRYEEAASIRLEKAIDYNPAILYYNAACAYALAGNSAAAMQRLEKLVYEHDFSDTELLENEADFIKLRQYKNWATLVAGARLNQRNKEAREITRKRRLLVDSKLDEIVFQPLSDFAQSMLEQDSLPFLSINHANFRLYYAADSYAATQLYHIKIELDDAFERAKTVLGIAQWNKGYHVLLVNSLDEMAQVSGLRVQGGVALVGHDLMVLPYRPERRPQFRHEFFHLLTNDYWGQTNSRLLNEGSAVYADDQCYIENPIFPINAHLMQAGKLVPLEALIHRFDEQALQSDVVAYLQSAAIFKYLFERHGPDKMKALWQLGFADFEKIYDQPLSAFEAEWLLFIQSLTAIEAVDLDLLLREGCG